MIMATKKIELEKLEKGEGCLAKSQPGEPVFILVARDKLAPQLVEDWAKRGVAIGVNNEKVMEAFRLADEMRIWQEKHGSKVPD